MSNYFLTNAEEWNRSIFWFLLHCKYYFLSSDVKHVLAAGSVICKRIWLSLFHWIVKCLLACLDQWVPLLWLTVPCQYCCSMCPTCPCFHGALLILLKGLSCLWVQLLGVPVLGWAGLAHLAGILLPWAVLGGDLSLVSEQAGLWGWGCRAAVPCHVHSAPCCVFKDQTAAVTSTMLCSQPDPKALPAALASAFFVLAFPLLQNSHLSPARLPHLTASGQQRGGQASRWLLALPGCAGTDLGSTVMKALDAPRASLLSAVPAVELSCSDSRDLVLHLGSPEQSCKPQWCMAELWTEHTDISCRGQSRESCSEQLPSGRIHPQQTGACKQILTWCSCWFQS